MRAGMVAYVNKVPRDDKKRPCYNPPSLRNKAASFSVKDATESRDCRTSWMSFSAGFALIASSVTGWGSAFPAFSSTQTHSPFSSGSTVGSG